MTENNVAAQAGDELMRAVRSIGTDRAFEAAAKALHLAWTPVGVHALIAAADAFVAAQVSPRATADVELREAVGKLIKAKGRFHTEQNYAAVVAAYGATTKPGA